MDMKSKTHLSPFVNGFGTKSLMKKNVKSVHFVFQTHLEDKGHLMEAELKGEIRVSLRESYMIKLKSWYCVLQ